MRSLRHYNPNMQTLSEPAIFLGNSKQLFPFNTRCLIDINIKSYNIEFDCQ